MISPTPGVWEDKKESSIALFVRKVCVGYAKYFNNKYGRTGSLFEGRFKAVHIIDDIQAKYLFSYIHLNPVKLIQSDWKEKGIMNKEEALNFLRGYRWGSYQDYLGVNRKENKILNREKFPSYFSNISDFNKEILDWLNFKEER